jgi:tetratricopeptide (TPR) repeat protein
VSGPHPAGGPDPVALETSAMELLQRGRTADALKIFYRLAEGDPSLDGGYLGWRIGQCYEALGDLNAAHYWHTRAVEINPAVRTLSVEALKRIGDPALDELLITNNPPLRSYG